MDKNLMLGSLSMLVIKLLAEEDMYGYQIIETLAKRSDDTFALKAGTLYPILHELEREGVLDSYRTGKRGGRVRIYYHLTEEGKKRLEEKQEEWRRYTAAINLVLSGG